MELREKDAVDVIASLHLEGEESKRGKSKGKKGRMEEKVRKRER